MSVGKIVVGVAAGVAAGVAVGILLAPEKGSDLREKIKGGDYLDDIKGFWNDCLVQLTDKLGLKDESLQFAHANVGGEKYGQEGNVGGGTQSTDEGQTTGKDTGSRGAAGTKEGKESKGTSTGTGSNL